MTFVLDASLVLSWFFEDEVSEYAEAVKESLRRSDAAAPGLWPAEVANGLVVAQRRKRVSAETVHRAPTFCTGCPFTLSQAVRRWAI